MEARDSGGYERMMPMTVEISSGGGVWILAAYWG